MYKERKYTKYLSRQGFQRTYREKFSGMRRERRSRASDEAFTHRISFPGSVLTHHCPPCHRYSHSPQGSEVWHTIVFVLFCCRISYPGMSVIITYISTSPSLRLYSLPFKCSSSSSSSLPPSPFQSKS